MAEECDPIGQDAGSASWAAKQGAEYVLEDLRSILQEAGEQYQGELRIDASNEVADTVRFVQTAMPWSDRISNHAQLKLHLQHEDLPVIAGQILWVSAQFLCMVDDRYEYLVNLEHVLMVSGLPSVGAVKASSAVTTHMGSIWLSGLLEDQQLASWYVAPSQVLFGVCTRLGLDAVDVQADRLRATLLSKHIVAVRIALQG